MTRERLPDRRPSYNATVHYALGRGKEIALQVTFGLDAQKRVREVFCADFKAGSDNQALMMDGCVLLSKLMQHGVDLDAIAASLCQPPSFLGAVASAAADFDKEPKQ